MGFTIIPTGMDFMEEGVLVTAMAMAADMDIGLINQAYVPKNHIPNREVQSQSTALIHTGLVKSSEKGSDGREMSRQHDSNHRSDSINLAKSQKQNYSIVENSADGLFLHDDLGNILEVNQAACNSLGYTRKQLLDLNILDVEKALKEFAQFKEFTQSLEFDKTVTVDGIHQRKDGSQFPVEVRVRRFLSDDQPLTIAVARDVTERKKIEEELLRARKLESIGLLAGGIAHDFNNLLSMIQGYIDLAGRRVNDDELQNSYLVKAKQASARASELTQQLLTFSKGGEPVKKTENISDIIQKSIDFILHGSNIDVVFHCKCDLSKVNVDTGQISQVIQNLAINARQAMPEGGVINICCENTVIANSIARDGIFPGRYIKIQFKDSGTGISQDIIDKIFDPYFTTKQKGSGLGLALSYSIIKKHGGYMTVRSEVNQGATFTIYLPESEEPVAEPPIHLKPEGNRRFMRVMIMDDDAMIRDVGSEMLRSLGYDVMQSINGEDAIEKYRSAIKNNTPIDLIIMDLTITHGMGGKETIKKLLELDPGVKVIVSSGYSNDPVMANYKHYGFKGALSKPYDQDELETSILSLYPLFASQ